MKKLLKKRLNQKGLTLIELLAVIVILAIVAAIAIPAISNLIENSRVGAIKSDALNAISAANLYQADGNAIDATNGVAVSALQTAGYLDNIGQMDDANLVVKVAGNDLVFDGTIAYGTTGLTVDFDESTVNEINAVPNNAASGTAVGSVTVTRP